MLMTMHLCLRLAPLLSMLLVAYWDGISGAAGTPAAKHPPRWQAASVGYPSPEEGELASRFFENPHLWGGDPVMAVPKEEEQQCGMIAATPHARALGSCGDHMHAARGRGLVCTHCASAAFARQASHFPRNARQY